MARGTNGADRRRAVLELVGQESRPRPRLELIGGFRLLDEDREVPVHSNGQRLLALLALGGQPIRRTVVAGTLWPNLIEQRAERNLRTEVWRLTQLPCSVILSTRQHLSLRPAIEVDVRDATRRAHEVVAGAPRGAEACPVEGAPWIHLFSADLLPDCEEEWLLGERERYLQIRVRALEQLCRRFTERREYALAVEAGMAAASVDPLRESVQRALIAAHFAEGNPSDALRQYTRYREQLRRDLGIMPTRQLEDELQHHIKDLGSVTR